MGTVRISERFAFTGGKVSRPGDPGHDKPYPIIRDVLLCGATSANKRRYRAGAFGPPGEKKYEGKPVFLDHTGKDGRKYRDHVGWVESERRRADGMPVGDIGVKPTHEQADSVLWDAEHRPNNCGMSHVASCETKRGRDGWDDVESVNEVESVDIVIGPATTKSFFEQGTAAVEITFGQLMESQEAKLAGDVRKGFRRLLVEMDGDPLMDAPVDAPLDSADHGTVVDGAISSVMTSAVQAYTAGDIDEAELGKRIKTAAKAHPKLKGETKDKDGGDSEPAEEPKETPESVQLRAENDRLIKENIDLTAKAAGVSLTDLQRAVLARSTDAERKALIESWQPAKAQPEKPKSAGRIAAADLLKESTGAKAPPPAPSVIVFDATGNRLVMN